MDHEIENVMKQLIFLPILIVVLGCGPAAHVSEQDWRLSYSRTCTFPLEGGTEQPESCDQFYRYSVHRDEEGRSFKIWQYKWVGKNGREVVYAPEIGGFGVGIFTIGVLSDSSYRGGSSFDPAVSHAMHRNLTVIGAPNDIYQFTVEDVPN